MSEFDTFASRFAVSAYPAHQPGRSTQGTGRSDVDPARSVALTQLVGRSRSASPRVAIQPPGLGRMVCAWYGMCMYSERTQVLLSPEQVERLKRLARRDGRSLGAVIRDAVDAYTLGTADRHAAIERLLSMEAPVDDWEVMKAEILRGAIGEP